MLRSVSDQVPGAIDFGFCPIEIVTTRTIILENPNDVPLKFSFEDSTFTVNPIQGILEPRGKILPVISFTPKDATAVVSTIILRIEGEEAKVIKISAIGKYPHISVNVHNIDFENVLVGKSLTRDLIIKNHSQVKALFTIEKVKHDDFKDSAFKLDFTHGEIPPKSSFLVKITYTPTVAHLISVTQFDINCVGGKKLE